MTLFSWWTDCSWCSWCYPFHCHSDTRKRIWTNEREQIWPSFEIESVHRKAIPVLNLIEVGQVLWIFLYDFLYLCLCFLLVRFFDESVHIFIPTNTRLKNIPQCNSFLLRESFLLCGRKPASQFEQFQKSAPIRTRLSRRRSRRRVVAQRIWGQRHCTTILK